MTVTGQRARILHSIVANRRRAIRRNHVHVKVHKALPGDRRTGRSHAMGGMTG